MKNIIIFVIFILCLVLFQFISAQSVDEVINKYIVSRGGFDKLKSLHSVYMEGTREMMGGKVLVKMTKVDGKLFRTDFEFDGNSGYTIVTPDRGWTYTPMGYDRPLEMSSAMLYSMKMQMDIAGPLISYKSKGYTAELQGKETVNGSETYKVVLTHHNGKSITYFLDIETGLLVQSSQMSEGLSNNNGSQQITTLYKDYKEVDGIMFPQTIVTEGGGMNEGSIKFDKIELNNQVDDRLYSPGNNLV